jgi:hypothetical protein
MSLLSQKLDFLKQLQPNQPRFARVGCGYCANLCAEAADYKRRSLKGEPN